MPRVYAQVCIADPCKVVNKFDHTAQHNLFDQNLMAQKRNKMILAFINFYDTNYWIILHKIVLEKLAKLIPRGHALVYIVDHLGSN